jgi:tyrosyl-tRNA synthetase
MSSIFEILKERGFVQQCTNEEGLRQALEHGPIAFYSGYDPTGSSLHVGHLVPLMAMAHLQRAGHKPIALVGGGTARIGDPSGKTETRKMLTIETIKDNANKFKTQIAHFLDFSHDRALMVDNADWLTQLNYIDFLRDIGRHFSVNRMLSFETYKMRLETGLSFIEFNYQLLQSYDFLVLFQKYGCVLQLGGDDQWANIISGMELVRRLEGKEVFGLTCPLVTRADGKKMGKTEKGALFLDPQLVSPYEFYQYWINIADADVGKFLLLYTFLPKEEVARLAGLKDKEINHAKEVLAFELTSLVHGKTAAEDAKETSRQAFGSGATKGSEAALSAMPAFDLSQAELAKGVNVVDLFTLAALCPSKSEARRLVAQGGAYVNDKKIDSLEEKIDASHVKDGLLVLRAGKKRYAKANIL